MATKRVVPAGKSRVRVAEGVYLQANGKYLAMYTDPGHKQRWRQHDTEKAARLWRANALVDPASMVQGKRPLGEIWKTFMDQRGVSLRPTTRANWEQEWRLHIEPAFGHWPVGKITIPAIKTYLAELEADGVGAATRSKCRSILHRLFEEALENTIVRTGRTNDFARREGEHKSSFPGLEFRVLFTADALDVQKGLEQLAYYMNPQAMVQNGGLNKRRPVAPKNPNLPDYFEAAGAQLRACL